MTQFTSFVAVEEMTITDGGVPRRVEVPVEMPEGVSRRGVFGEEDEKRPMMKLQNTVTLGGQAGANYGAGRGGGGGGGVALRRRANVKLPKPAATPSNRPVIKPSANTSAYVIDGDASVDKTDSLSPEERKRQEMTAKLHPSIVAVIDRLAKKSTQPAPDEARFIRANLAEVQIWLTEKTPEALAQLKQLGFEVVLDPVMGKLVIGRMPIEKLSKLAELKFVRYVAPQLGSS
jgi:hypothetical protein